MVALTGPVVHAGVKDLGAVGNDRLIWAYRLVKTAPESPPVWRLAYRTSGAHGAAVWVHPFGFGEATGEMGATALRGERLHVVYGDGTHRIYSRRRATVGRKLPLPVVPVAMAGDDLSGVVYALVPKHVAETLKVDRPPPVPSPGERAETPPNEESNGNDAGAGAADEDRWPESRYVLMRYESGRWHADRGVPPWLDQRSGVWLTASGGAVEIIFASPGTGGTYRYSTSPDIEHGWGEPETVEELDSGELLAALTLSGGTVLLYSGAGGRSVATLRRGDDGWITGRNLTLDGAEWTVPASGVVFATLGERIAGMWIPHDGVVRWGEWDVDGGEAVVGKSPLRALSPNSGPAMTRRVATAVTYVVLVVTLVTVFVRRRRSVFTPATLKPEQRPAGFGRRVLAFGIDATLFIPGTTYAFAPMLREYGFDSQMLLQVAASDNEVMNELSLRWLAAVAAFVVYATTFELWWGATPGKRLMRCRVVTDRGERCGFGRVLLRNVLRGVEFYPYMILLWTLTLVVLTRNRQRLGDLIAGTVVVEEKPSAGSAD